MALPSIDSMGVVTILLDPGGRGYTSTRCRITEAHRPPDEIFAGVVQRQEFQPAKVVSTSCRRLPRP